MSEPATSLPYALPDTDSDAFAVALGIVGLKLLGVLQLLESIIYLPTLLMFFTSNNLFGTGSQLPFVVMYGVTMCLKIAVGLGALWKAGPISRRLFTGVPAGDRGSVDAIGWLTLIFLGIAVLTILNALQAIVAAAATWFSSWLGTTTTFGTATSFLFSQSGVVGSTVQLGLGIALLFFARPIARWGLQTAMRKA